MRKFYNTYYLAFGENGAVIVYGNYTYAQSFKQYLGKMNTRRFGSFEEAEQAMYDHLCEVMPYYIHIPEHFQVGELLTYSILKRRMAAEGTL